MLVEVPSKAVTSPILTIDLHALARNYRHLAQRTGAAPIAMVKADGYGLGATEVCLRLWREGCRRFFVARVDEGIRLREALPEAEIGVLDGAVPGSEAALTAYSLVPVLNSLEQVDRWRRAAAEAEQLLPAALHFDTGMHRLGIPAAEVHHLSQDPGRIAGLDIRHVMSHLACADSDVVALAGKAEAESADEQVPDSRHQGQASPSEQQLEAFLKLRAMFPQGAASLANSAGIFLDPRFRMDLTRPGIALYGGCPWGQLAANPMEAVATLEAPVIQVQDVPAGATVGYGATWQASHPTRLATLPVGYADGYHRSASNQARVWFGNVAAAAPIVGRVSMDLTIVDIGHLPEGAVTPGTTAELMGAQIPVDEVAANAGTIGYELLTGLGLRYQRRYVDGE